MDTDLGEAFPAMGVLGTKTGAARFADNIDGSLDALALALALAGAGTEAGLWRYQQSAPRGGHELERI